MLFTCSEHQHIKYQSLILCNLVASDQSEVIWNMFLYTKQPVCHPYLSTSCSIPGSLSIHLIPTLKCNKPLQVMMNIMLDLHIDQSLYGLWSTTWYLTDESCNNDTYGAWALLSLTSWPNILLLHIEFGADTSGKLMPMLRWNDNIKLMSSSHHMNWLKQ